jgi:hypothetical protein
MTLSTTPPPSPPGPLRRARTRVNRRLAGDDGGALFLLSLVAVFCALLVFLWPSTWPVALMTLPLVPAAMLLSPRALSWFVVGALALTVVAFLRQPDSDEAIVVQLVLVFVIGFLVLMLSFRRSTLGVGGVRGESMFVDLRDRIMRQGQLPAVPDGWSVDYALRSAGGTPFSGDFAVGFLEGEVLQVALVDVSGKGDEAGTRALLLGGAMAGLLGALPPDRFLAETSDYLCRQDWDEGFATAVHLSIHLATGEYELRSAGHPPGVHLNAGSGRWWVRESEGPVLGLIPGVDYEPVRGLMGHGDTIMLYTDGLVEDSSRELGVGIDRLLGRADRVLHGGPDRAAKRLVEDLGSRQDDSALILVHRR